jgi:hypothetical protein
MDVGVGDVITVRTKGLAAWFIRLGAKMQGKPNRTNHVIIVHHQDDAGLWWGIEGRPGGIGDVQITSGMLRGAHTNTNDAQPKTEAQRYLVAVAAEQVKGTPYDWASIRHHVWAALTAKLAWDSVLIGNQDWPEGKVPAQMVCSSFAAWAYEKVGLPTPNAKRTRMISPGDWDWFIDTKAWAR